MLMAFDPTFYRQYEIEQQQIFLEAKESAHKFFEAMGKLDSKYFAKLIDELTKEGMMRQVVNVKGEKKF